MFRFDVGTQPHALRHDRRWLIRSGTVAGAAGLLALPASSRAQMEDSLELDVACDGRTFRLIRVDPAQADAPPMMGDTFIVVGSIYPAGAIEEGLAGPDQEGAIGRWVCRGTFALDAATAEEGAALAITTVLFALGEGLSSTAGQLQAAPDGIVTEGFEPESEEPLTRGIIGGYGAYGGVRGDQIQVVRGTNDTEIMVAPEIVLPAPNFTFTFAFAS